MISFLKGFLRQKTDKYVIIENNGIGFKIFLSAQAITDLPPLDKEVKLYTYLHLTEENPQLYGFLSLEDLSLFENLITVPGVGPKLALGILSIGSVEKIKTAILSDDDKYLAKAPLVGPKMAKKIILELSSKIKLSPGEFIPEELKEESDVVDALINLGYNKTEIRKAFKSLPPEIKGLEAKIKSLLKILGSH